jgi:hypothetical protein
MRSACLLPTLVVAASVLAGCGPKSATSDAKAPAGGSEPAVAAASAAPADVVITPKGAPQRRDGYWEMASYADTGTPMSKQFYCVGAGSEQKYSLFDALASVGDCDKKDFKRTPAGWTFATRCQLMNATTTQTGTITGDFQQSFLIDQTVSQGAHTQKGTIRGRRVGDCPSKFKPGDLVDADGERLGNLLG